MNHAWSGIIALTSNRHAKDPDVGPVAGWPEHIYCITREEWKK